MEFKDAEVVKLVDTHVSGACGASCAGSSPAFGTSHGFMFFVYAIKSTRRNYIYVGLTNNFDRRFREHNSGHNRTTKPYAPFEKLHLEFFQTRVEARTREKYLKSGIGKEFLKRICDEQT